jgi:hypothetical protein
MILNVKKVKGKCNTLVQLGPFLNFFMPNISEEEEAVGAPSGAKLRYGSGSSKWCGSMPLQFCSAALYAEPRYSFGSKKKILCYDVALSLWLQLDFKIQKQITFIFSLWLCATSYWNDN